MVMTIDNLKCCGNCKNKTYYDEYEYTTCDIDEEYIVNFRYFCKNWRYDGYKNVVKF